MIRETSQATQKIHYAMGTVMSHKAFGLQAEQCLTVAEMEIARIETELSRFLPESDISRVNASAGFCEEPVNIDTLAVLSRAAKLSKDFPGCFSVTVGPLVRLWQNAAATNSQPSPEEIRRTLGLVNDGDILLNAWAKTAMLNKFGESIDLGGIGKGFAADEIRKVFAEYEIDSAYSNLGGNVIAIGTKPDGSPWRIGIQHPRDERRMIGSVVVQDQAVVTSGDYQRFYIDSEGRRQHHILNPVSGMPANSGLISTTIIAEKAMDADALSTILFVAGLEKSLEFLGRLEHIEAVLVDENLNGYVTRGLKGRFQADENINFTYVN